MPTLREPSHKQPFPEEWTGTSATQSVLAADKVRSTLDAVTDGVGGNAGNSVDDQLTSIKNSVADAGTDLSDLTVTARTPEANDAILERLNDGTTQFNRTLISMLLAAQTESDVSTLIATQIARLATNARWRGNWTPADFNVHDYVTHSSSYFRCILARSSADATGPAGDTTGWVEVTGAELQVVQRLRDIVELLQDRIEITPATSNRGRWIVREHDAEGYEFSDAPMQFKGNWNNSTNYYFGHVTVRNDRLWVLTSAGSRTTAKQGDTTAPGTDSDWTEISIGHHLDIPHFQGDWADLGGHTFKIGDTIEANDLTYICKEAYTRTNASSHPSADSQHWDLLDNWVGAISNSTAYHEGATGTADGEIWVASEDIETTDPEPAALNNTKWRQISGATQDDLTRLRTDLQNEFHSASRSRGPTVHNLPEPPTANSPIEVFLSVKHNRTYNAPAGQIVGSSQRSESIGDEVGLYKRTAGTVNHLTGIIGTETYEDDTYYGIFTRPEQDPSNNVVAGKFTHNPMGSVFIHAGIKQIGTNGDWGPTCLIKQNALILAGGGTQLRSFWLKIWSHDGTPQTGYHMNRLGRVYTIGNVNYQEMFGTVSATAGAFKTLYDAGSSDADREIEMSIATTAAGSDLYLGNRTIAWRKETDVSESDSNLVFSEQVHTLQLIGSSAYATIVQLPANTAFFIYDDS